MNIFSSKPKTFGSSLLTDQDPYGLDNWLSLRRKLNFFDPEQSSLNNPDKNENPIRTDDDSDLDEIVRRGSTDLEMLREHIARMPRREDHAMSVKDRILASLVSAGGALSSGNVGTGIRIGQQITEAPYERAMEEYKAKASGLGDLADISSQQLSRHVQLENIKGTREDRALRFEQMKQAEQDRHEVALQRAQTDADRLAETARHNKETERMDAILADIKRTAGGRKGGIEKITTRNAEGRKVVRYVTDEEALQMGDIEAPLSADEQRRVDQAKIIKAQGERVKAQIVTAEKALGPINNALAKVGVTDSALGPLGGRVSELEKKVGFEHPKIRALYTAIQSLDSLMPIIHGYRGGVQTHKVFQEATGHLHTNPAALKKAIEAYQELADDIINGITEYGDNLEGFDENALRNRVFGDSKVVPGNAGSSAVEELVWDPITKKLVKK